MKLVFVTDNGFSSKGERYYYSGANAQHYATATKYFREIVFIARDTLYEASSSEISNNYKTYLVESITSGKNFVENYMEINQILEKEIKDADIVMCFGLNGYLAYKKAKKYKKPIITFVGGSSYEILKNMDSVIKRLSAPIMRSMIRNMVRNSDYVHYVDNSLFDKYPTNNEYMVCSDAAIKIQEGAIDLRLGKILSKTEKDTITIGVIGYTHNRIKGIDTAIRALSLLDGKYRLQIVGRGNNDWLNELASNLNIIERVEFLGILNGRKEIFNWLDSIDIYVQPSLTEGMPRATLEAMSRGCPIVSTSVGGLKKLIDSEDRIDIGDYAELAERVSRLSKSQNILKEKAIRNFEVAKEYEYNKLNLVKKEFYEKILKDLE